MGPCELQILAKSLRSGATGQVLAECLKLNIPALCDPAGLNPGQEAREWSERNSRQCRGEATRGRSSALEVRSAPSLGSVTR